jgi:uncharacterized protein YjbI with pentapeptide repeats
MNKIPLLPWRLAGLFHPDWALRLGATGAEERRESGPDGLELEGQLIARLGPLDPAQGRVASLLRSDLTSGAVEGVELGRAEQLEGRGSAWMSVRIGELVLCDLGGSRLEDVVIDRAVGVCLRGAELRNCEIRSAVMVDLSGARLQGVRLGHATTVDLSGARLQGCSLGEADLRGARLRRASFVDTPLDGARVAGADLTGARGIERGARRELIRAGARFRAAGWLLVLRRLLPSADPLRLERFALGLQLAAVALGVLLCAGALFEVLRPRGVAPLPEPPPPLAREATAWEIDKTRDGLLALRAALQAAHDTMVANGAQNSSWPSMTDFQQNTYDLDGDGPGELREPLVPGGMPDNLLTDSVGGVLPYCNDVPTQETIAGVDTDWHYCELSGRVFACAGYTELPTLEW